MNAYGGSADSPRDKILSCRWVRDGYAGFECIEEPYARDGDVDLVDASGVVEVVWEVWGLVLGGYGLIYGFGMGGGI